MSVWLTIPSARPVEQIAPVLAKWRAQGYKIALWRDKLPDVGLLYADVVISSNQPYPGYAVATNSLIAQVAENYSDAEWFVCAGDDTLPDPNHTADEIARECRAHFDALACVQHRTCGCLTCKGRVETFGVMQPTGDRWGTPRRAYIDHVAGSPWIGREFARRMYQGKGPYWHEYTHMGVDEELQKVAIKYGVFWQRPDLTHYHEHWARKGGQAIDMPAFLAEANSRAHWDRFKKIMSEREAAGFPGSEPL